MSRTKLASWLSGLILLTFLVLPSGGLAQGSTWTQAGTFPSGTWSLAATANGSALYALGNSGIQRSSDQGASWSACNREARTMFALTPLADPQAPTMLYATTANGLRVTDDGCRTWRDVPTNGIAPSASHIRWLAPYPDNYSVLYAGMDGLGGLYRSTDSGAGWQPASTGMPAGAWVTSLVAEPAHPSHVLVSVRYAGRSQYPPYIFGSTDGGLTWKSSSSGVHVTPAGDSAVLNLAWSGSNLLAATTHDGLYRSTDAGVTWSPSVTPGAPVVEGTGPGLAPRIESMASTPDGVLVLATSGGTFASLNGGQSWQAFGPGETTGKDALLYVDRNSGRVLLGSGSDLFTYQIPQGVTILPTPSPTVAPTSSPTPPLPPQVPTATAVPPTSTPSATPTPIPPSPTVPVVNGKSPTDPADPLDSSGKGYFQETKHNVGPTFLAFWNANGGVAQFGYPITELFDENGASVQYFERARFELRNGGVELGRLGVELTQGQFFRPIPFFPSTDTNAFFGATGHSVGGPFLDFWRAHGQEALLGYPLSESYKDDGSEYQWFERGRLEWHPYLPESRRIVLGNVGSDVLKARGWIK
jgi:hypothetical protein